MVVRRLPSTTSGGSENKTVKITTDGSGCPVRFDTTATFCIKSSTIQRYGGSDNRSGQNQSAGDTYLGKGIGTPMKDLRHFSWSGVNASEDTNFRFKLSLRNRRNIADPTYFKNLDSDGYLSGSDVIEAISTCQRLRNRCVGFQSGSC